MSFSNAFSNSANSVSGLSSVRLLAYEGRHVQIVRARGPGRAGREVWRRRVARRRDGRAAVRRAHLRHVFVEARRDDSYLHLVMQRLINHRAEDYVRLFVGRLAYDRGSLVHLVEREV